MGWINEALAQAVVDYDNLPDGFKPIFTPPYLIPLD